MNHRVQMKTPIGVLTIESNEKAVTYIGLPVEGAEHVPGERRDGPRPNPQAKGSCRTLWWRPSLSWRSTSQGTAGASTFPWRWPVRTSRRACGSNWLRIPYGETVSYAELALMVGRPHAYRAVGQANGANPIPIVLPCHRVVASGGGIGGYGGGLPMKRKLLTLEGAPIS